MNSQTFDHLPPSLLTLSRYDMLLVMDFMLHQNTVLRDKFPGRVPLTDCDRHTLVTLGLCIRKVLADVISIVKPETLLAWNRRMKREKWTYDNKPKSPGRPRKGRETEQLVLRLAEENAWGYDRIAGELRKLGHAVSPGYVHDVLKRHGIPPCPNRKGLSWKSFIQAHLDVAWATDFFTEEVWTLAGRTTYYVLFFIHLATRRVYFASCSPTPQAEWVSQQARNLSMFVAENEVPCRFLIHDHDSSFLPLDHVLKSEFEIVKTPVHAPQCNAYAERFVRESGKTLDNLILLGERHFRHVLKRIERHHNLHRPHQGIANRIPLDYPYPDRPMPPNSVQCDSELGGLLNHYYAA